MAHKTASWQCWHFYQFLIHPHLPSTMRYVRIVTLKLQPLRTCFLITSISFSTFRVMWKCYLNSGYQILNVCSDYNILLMIVSEKSFSWDLLDSHTQRKYFSHLFTWYLLQQRRKRSVFSSQPRSSMEHLSGFLAPENILLWWKFGFSYFISHEYMILNMTLKSLLSNVDLLSH